MVSKKFHTASFLQSLQGNSFSLSAIVFILPVAVFLILTPLLIAVSVASEKDISNYRSKIYRLQQSILTQETRISEGREKERTILEEIEILHRQMGAQQKKLDKLALQVLRQEILIDNEEEELVIIRERRRDVEDHLQRRITAYYTMGNIGVMNVTFSTKTLPELLSFHDAFEILIKYDRKVILDYKSTIDAQERIKNALELEKSMLVDFLNQSVQEKELLEETQSKKNNLLVHVRTQSKLHQQAIDELNQASKQLVDSIVTLKNNSEILEKGFTSNKGSLPPPIDGTLITLFKEEKTNKLGVKKQCLGIELKAPDGTNIIAVSEGEVIFSGYLRGYGNTIIIHHGYQYYTVTSRIEKLTAEKGDKVEVDDIIGVVGDTATLFDEGLYFEIRHGRNSLDPLLWLNPTRLSSLHE
jgi:septal ring factor EnvC (AmiA/AmiB activator)